VVDWLLLVALAGIWGVLLLPLPFGRRSDGNVERSLQALAYIQERQPTPGRWVLAPRRDVRFIGPGERARARLRERRRRVLSVLGEALAFSVLIGAFPPLRAMWVVSALLAGLILVYLGALLRMRNRGPRTIRLPEEDLAVVRSEEPEPRRAVAAR